jgi:hypothetical protein
MQPIRFRKADWERLGADAEILKPSVKAKALPLTAETAWRGMNGGERAYARYLDKRRMAGEIVWWAYEPLKLRLAEGAWYTPDFVIQMADGTIEIHEYKGFMREAARVRLLVASDRFPFFPFRLIRAIPVRQGGGFKVEDVRT